MQRAREVEEARTRAPLNRPVRVVFSLDNMQVGGTELNAVRTAERLDRSLVDLSVVCMREDGPLIARYERAGIRVNPFPLKSLYSPGTLAQAARLTAFLRGVGAEVVHAHDIYSNVFTVACGRAAGAKTIASRRWWECAPGAHWRAASRFGYAAAHATLANSPGVSKLLQSEGVPASRIAVIPNFLDEAAFEKPAQEQLAAMRQDLGLTARHRVIGIVANLLPVKDHRGLLHAMAELAVRWPDLRLVLVGDGPERPALEQLATDLGLASQVIFAGRRPSQPSYHHLFELSVLCSVSEGLPNSILEAMASGNPVVATDVGAIADTLVDGETGFLIPPSRPTLLAHAIDRLLRNPAFGKRMGAAGAVRARELHSADAAVGRLQELYFRLARQPSISRAGV